MNMQFCCYFIQKLNPVGISHRCITCHFVTWPQNKPVSVVPDSRFELLNEAILLILVFHPVHAGNDKLRHHTALGTRPAHNHPALLHTTRASEKAELRSVRTDSLTFGSGSGTARRSATGGCSSGSTCGSSWTGCRSAARTETPSRTPHPDRSCTACPDSAAPQTPSPCPSQRPPCTSGTRQNHHHVTQSRVAYSTTTETNYNTAKF